MVKDALNNLVDYHHVLMREYRYAIDLMQSGRLTPRSTQGGRSLVNITAEMIADLTRMIAEMEVLNAKIQAAGATWSSWA